MASATTVQSSDDPFAGSARVGYWARLAARPSPGASKSDAFCAPHVQSFQAESHEWRKVAGSASGSVWTPDQTPIRGARAVPGDELRSSDADTATTAASMDERDAGCDGKAVLRVNSYLDGISEEFFLKANIEGETTRALRSQGRHTARLTIASHPDRMRMAQQVMAGYVRWRRVQAIGSADDEPAADQPTPPVARTAPAIMFFETEEVLEILARDEDFTLGGISAVEVLPVLPLRKWRRSQSPEERKRAIDVDFNCVTYLPPLVKPSAVAGHTGAARRPSNAAHCGPGMGQCTQSCSLCVVS